MAVSAEHLVVAGGRVDPERRLEVGQRGDLGGVARRGAVDEVAGDDDEVRVLGVDEVDDLPGERRAAHRPGVQVGDQSDPHPVELLAAARPRPPRTG